MESINSNLFKKFEFDELEYPEHIRGGYTVYTAINGTRDACEVNERSTPGQSSSSYDRDCNTPGCTGIVNIASGSGVINTKTPTVINTDSPFVTTYKPKIRF